MREKKILRFFPKVIVRTFSHAFLDVHFLSPRRHRKRERFETKDSYVLKTFSSTTDKRGYACKKDILVMSISSSSYLCLIN